MPGGAGGSILAMILSLKNNKAILPKRKSLKEIREIYSNNANHPQLFNKKSDPAFLEELRKQLIKERRVDIIKRIVLICFSIAVLIALFYIPFLVIHNIGLKKNQEIIENYKRSKKEKYRAYEMFIYYGDYHFNHKEYSDAIKNYKFALKTSPNKFQSYYELATIYCFACLDSNMYCQEAITFLTGTIEKTDTSTYALKLWSEVYMHLGEYSKAENDLERIEENK